MNLDYYESLREVLPPGRETPPYFPERNVLRQVKEVKHQDYSELTLRHHIIVPNNYTTDMMCAIAIFELAKDIVARNNHKREYCSTLDIISIAACNSNEIVPQDQIVALMKCHNCDAQLFIGFEDVRVCDSSYEVRDPNNYNCNTTVRHNSSGKMWSKYGPIISRGYPWLEIELADLIQFWDNPGKSCCHAYSMNVLLGLTGRNFIPVVHSTFQDINFAINMDTEMNLSYRDIMTLRAIQGSSGNSNLTVKKICVSQNVDDLCALLSTVIKIWAKPIPLEAVYATDRRVQHDNGTVTTKLLVFSPPGVFSEEALERICKLCSYSKSERKSFYWIIDFGSYALIMHCDIAKINDKYELIYYVMNPVVSSPFSLFSSGSTVVRIADSSMESVSAVIRWIDTPKEYVRSDVLSNTHINYNCEMENLEFVEGDVSKNSIKKEDTAGENGSATPEEDSAFK